MTRDIIRPPTLRPTHDFAVRAMIRRRAGARGRGGITEMRAIPLRPESGVWYGLYLETGGGA
eukprot:1023254-Prymnesium_polylepis.1